MSTVIESIEDIIREVRAGTYTESDAAILITRDAETGTLTFSFHGVDSEEGWEMFKEAARVRGFIGSEYDHS
jgi:hypothetical protein